jgi:hypothetical protein
MLTRCGAGSAGQTDVNAPNDKLLCVGQSSFSPVPYADHLRWQRLPCVHTQPCVFTCPKYFRQASVSAALANAPLPKTSMAFHTGFLPDWAVITTQAHCDFAVRWISSSASQRASNPIHHCCSIRSIGAVNAARCASRQVPVPRCCGALCAPSPVRYRFCETARVCTQLPAGSFFSMATRLRCDSSDLMKQGATVTDGLESQLESHFFGRAVFLLKQPARLVDQ